MKKLTNNAKIPISLAVWLATDSYDHDDRPNLISATSLLKPMRELILSRQFKDIEQTIDISSLIASSMGTALHDSIERSWTLPGNMEKAMKMLGYPEQLIKRIVINPTAEELAGHPDWVPVYLEQRSEIEICGYIISGKFDFVIEASVEDFKSTSAYGFMMGSNTEKYMQQGSIYRWLNQDKITGDTVKIQLIFTDWSALKARTDKKYPQSKLLQQEIVLMSIEETQAFITNKLETLARLEAAPQASLPLCTADELWQKPDIWKYYKDPTKKTRSTKNFDNMNEAILRLTKDGNCGEVVHVPGLATKCKYCDVAEVCLQYTDLCNAGLLVL